MNYMLAIGGTIMAYYTEYLVKILFKRKVPP